MRGFPPRMSGQPIFHPVLGLGYAQQIARDWNATSGAMAGYVTRFEIDDAYANSFDVQKVGGNEHREFWVPASSVGEFNTHLVGAIRLIAAYFGSAFVGVRPAAFSLRGKSADAQFAALFHINEYSLQDFHGEVVSNHEAVFVNFPFWEQLVVRENSPFAHMEPLLGAIRQVWSGAFPSRPLGVESIS